MTEQYGQAMARPDKRSRMRRRLDHLWSRTKWHTYLLYCRTLYRPHMRLIHRWGWHWHTHLCPYPGQTEQLWCQWCGDRWFRWARRDVDDPTKLIRRERESE